MPDSKATVLLVEDNRELLWANRQVFAAHGYEVLAAETLAEAEAQLGEGADVVVLDLMLPDGNALDALPNWRARTDAPILILTALGDKDRRLAGLRRGGDDYLTKPYDIDELVARVEAALRREARRRERAAADGREAEIISGVNGTFSDDDGTRQRAAETLGTVLPLGPLTLDLIANQAFLRDVSLRLQPKEFALLLVLARHLGEPLAKEALYERVWRAPMAGDAGALWRQISGLRKKLASATDDVAVVVIPNHGYQLEIAAAP